MSFKVTQISRNGGIKVQLCTWIKYSLGIFCKLAIVIFHPKSLGRNEKFCYDLAWGNNFSSVVCTMKEVIDNNKWYTFI